MRPIRALKNNKARRLKQSEKYSEAVIALFCPLLIFLSPDKSSSICKKKKKKRWRKRTRIVLQMQHTNVLTLVDLSQWASKGRNKKERNRKDPASERSHLTPEPVLSIKEQKAAKKILTFQRTSPSQRKKHREARKPFFSEPTKQVFIWGLSRTATAARPGRRQGCSRRRGKKLGVPTWRSFSVPP